ncbi:MAG: outer membrane lipid asymmetry maintenance protein MlaD [Gammaproteobacteria bacterium]|jgi:phospholipid/cholesterol/gamma-HCH transport system substrate-binding protein
MNKGSLGTEFMVGVLMLAGAAALFFLAMKASNFASIDDGKDGYMISARFDNIGGLKVRAPVTLAGVRIGQVQSITVDSETFEAVVRMSIRSQYDKIPGDTFAKILTSGLLGEQYIGLDPGGSLENLADGDEITVTQSALVLEDIIGKFLFSKAEEASQGEGL